MTNGVLNCDTIGTRMTRIETNQRGFFCCLEDFQITTQKKFAPIRFNPRHPCSNCITSFRRNVHIRRNFLQFNR